MNLIHAHEFFKIQDFVTSAKLHFENNPNHTSYTDEEISSGCLFAMRWGADADSILVFRISEDMEPLVISNIIEK